MFRKHSELVEIDIFALCCILNFKPKWELFVYYSNYLNRNIWIVLFSIRSFSKTEYIRYSHIYQKPNIFRIQSILTIRDNTGMDDSKKMKLTLLDKFSFLIIIFLNDLARFVAWTDTRLFSPMLRFLRLEPEARSSNRVITCSLAMLVLQRLTSSILFRLLASMPGGIDLKSKEEE